MFAHHQLAIHLIFFVSLALLLVAPEVIDAIYGGVERGATATHFTVGQVKVLPVEFYGYFLRRRIQYGECPVSVSEGFEPELKAVAVCEVQSLHAK